MTQVILVELNEVNFDFIQRYADGGKLPHFKALIEQHGLGHTLSEKEYHEWEPWIQWVTAHTGQTLAEHKVFRLGDIVDTDIDQIWERLERKGLRVAALSPMNAKNRLSNPAFFLPDPWTKTEVQAPSGVRRVYEALASAINNNAAGSITPKTLALIALGLAQFARPANYLHYLRTAARAVSHSWPRAVFLDIFLGDLFIGMLRKTRPQFSSIFLNAAAHIQHHYMFSSDAYGGGAKNPTWYVPEGADPILDVYAAYDRFVGQLRKTFPDARLMIATGLHQEPHAEETYYWRLLNHRKFLEGMGMEFAEVEPRMSRDFVVFYPSAEAALKGEALLASARADDGQPLFSIDNRGDNLFVELVYPGDISPQAEWLLGNQAMGKLRKDVAFVAIKNGRHDGVGYFIDTMHTSAAAPFPLADLPARIEEACDTLERAAA